MGIPNWFTGARVSYAQGALHLAANALVIAIRAYSKHLVSDKLVHS
jgi:hypothetical protein